MATKTQEVTTIKETKKKGGWFDKFFLIFALVIALVVGYFVFGSSRQGTEPFIFGYRPYIITSGSMEPYLKVNCLVLIKKTDYEDVKEGDIVSFKMQETSVCHQVIEVTPSGLMTKGTNNFHQDAKLVKKEQFVGKLVFRSNTVANYINFLNKKGFFLAAVLQVAGLIFLISAFMFLKKKEKSTVVKIVEIIEVEDEPEPDENKNETGNEDEGRAIEDDNEVHKIEGEKPKTSG